jgi:hypothetical protein
MASMNSTQQATQVKCSRARGLTASLPCGKTPRGGGGNKIRVVGGWVVSTVGVVVVMVVVVVVCGECVGNVWGMCEGCQQIAWCVCGGGGLADHVLGIMLPMTAGIVMRLLQSSWLRSAQHSRCLGILVVSTESRLTADSWSCWLHAFVTVVLQLMYSHPWQLCHHDEAHRWRIRDFAMSWCIQTDAKLALPTNPDSLDFCVQLT